MNLAPIVLFVYNRQGHVQRTIDSLKMNGLARESQLFIYSDGPKHAGDEVKVKNVREYIKTVSGFKSIAVIERDKNLGLSRSIISGVSEIICKYGKVIVLEDDLLVSPFFLDYLNAALNLYEQDDRVMQISGNMFNIDFRGSVPESFFLPYTTTLGWGTWLRAWTHLDETLKGYEILKGNNDLRYKFDMNGTYPYFKMLENQRKRKVDSWGIQWYLSVFLNNGLVLHPRRSLIAHFGFDSEATHAKSGSVFYIEAVTGESISVFPKRAEINKEAFEYCVKFFRRRGGRGVLLRNIMNILERILTT